MNILFIIWIWSPSKFQSKVYRAYGYIGQNHKLWVSKPMISEQSCHRWRCCPTIPHHTNHFNHQVSLASPSQVLTPYQLMEINVNIDMDFTTVTYHKLQLPCYHACNYQERLYELEKCSQYLGVEGAAVYDAKSKKLLGVATWAPWSMSPVNSNNWKLNRIVGFSVANSPNFFEDWGCARRIRDEKTTDITTGHYQRMCDKL